MEPTRPIIPVEEQFRIIADSIPALIWIADTDKQCFFFNTGWLRFTGRTLEQEYGMRWADGVHPDDLQYCLNIYSASFHARKEFKIEYRFRKHDGTYQWMLNNGVPRYAPDGTYVGFIGSCMVITELLEKDSIGKEFATSENLKRERTLNEELAVSNEELAATNEELVSINEELYHTQDSLNRLNDELEEKITTRTMALAQSEAKTKSLNNKLEATVEELSLKNDELAAANEDLAAVNEEMAATNEEIAAINEELAATNEELTETQVNLQQLNTELAENESRLKMAIESTNLGTWDWNLMDDSLYLSAECSTIFGLQEIESITAETFSGLIYPEDQMRVQREIEKVLAAKNGLRYDINYRIIRSDSKDLRWIRVQGKVHFNIEGKAIRFVGTALDITNDKHAEEKSAKLAAIIASSDDAIISKTLESVITSWNESAERMFGYTAEEIIGETIYKLIPADRQKEEPEILSRLKRGDRVTHFETKRITKDGRLIDVSITVSPVKDQQGNIIGLSKIARDITENKLDEARKNDFIGMVSHELKTPLTSLKGLIQLANLKLKNSEDRFLRGAMEKADIQVKRMHNMINGFLNVSRLESGKIMIHKQEFNLDDLVKEVIKETELTVSSHLIKFTPCNPIIVNADHDKINSVITNLISNAIKYSPKGKGIDIMCRLNANTVVISVKDEGMGIKPEDKEKLFDRYYRVENTDTQHISGFGIGLYLCSEIIHRHEGKIWVESEPGIGSTFFFSLPLSVAD